MNGYIKKLLILLPVLALLLALPSFAAYSDTSGHWGESAIDEWSQAGIVQGAGGLAGRDERFEGIYKGL